MMFDRLVLALQNGQVVHQQSKELEGIHSHDVSLGYEKVNMATLLGKTRDKKVANFWWVPHIKSHETQLEGAFRELGDHLRCAK